MKRWLPHPVLWLLLWAMWLLLAQSVSPGQVLLGGVVAFVAMRAMAALEVERFAPRSLRAAARLFADVVVDVLRSNLVVASLVLFPRRQRVSAFVRLPLELRNRQGLAVLSLIITATPGTIWVDLDGARGMLLVHVLDLLDEEEWIRIVKRRYEAPLLEIFGP